MYASFNRFELKITKAQALQGSHQGQCIEDVKALAALPAIKAQLKKIAPEKIREELQEYGAWDEKELADDQENIYRIIWVACCDIREEIREQEKIKELTRGIM